ncbi:serine/threonine protein kinase [Chthoniobacter flavus Ellin428]|uniref:Serine/threonine protein kinase n=1 Tax=Chthoniobacter flavus Ellin428 TaxID=497964 RepID=B4D8F3_9BACT|nr:serine/threonine-protein kinase [Chthoniobacter flavus]EDY17346.1 serine/threonine protein kinase [Chthoniobacter flavus Ellin428]TCO90085.1 serine/threonine protein kinase [Chthoniobacter flavus]
MPPPSFSHKPLPAGYILDVYQFERVLGSPGTFGITYAARNVKNGKRLAIKELFPSDYVIRDGTHRVVVQTKSDEQVLVEAVRMFRQEATILSKVQHDNVIKVLDYLEANGTGYMVMNYEDGYDLQIHLDKQKPNRLNENELRRLLMPLLDGLATVHRLNYLHRDIKPSNIYLTREHIPLLLDFGAARQMIVSRSRPVEQILTPPYGPIEQYGKTSPQGPYTDIYAMGVVLFRAMLANERFPNAPDRMTHDPVVPLTRRLKGQEYSAGFLSAVDWALRFRAEDRPQTIHAWREAIEASQPKQRSHSKRTSYLEKLGRLRTRNQHAFWKLVAIIAGIVFGIIALATLITYLLMG